MSDLNKELIKRLYLEFVMALLRNGSYVSSLGAITYATQEVDRLVDAAKDFAEKKSKYE